MPIMLNTVLREAGLDPADVRVLRHKDTRATKGLSPYELWRDNRPQFEWYQSTQSITNRSKLEAPYWAAFVTTFDNEDLFAGLYSVRYRGLLESDTPSTHIAGATDKAGENDVWDTTLCEELSDLIGRMVIEWGPGKLAWVQYANKNDKPIVELRRVFREEDFPGFLNFIRPLSAILAMPKSWTAALSAAKGVYLLTCPKTREQYVGSASGEDGFLGRWTGYALNGHGGNVRLMSREPSDYQVSILEVAGTSATLDDILQMEGRWQAKLQTVDMGLNSAPAYTV